MDGRRLILRIRPDVLLRCLSGDTDDDDETFDEKEDLVETSDGTDHEFAKPHQVKEKIAEHNCRPQAGSKSTNNDHENRTKTGASIKQNDGQVQPSPSGHCINTVSRILGTTGNCQLQEQLQKQSTNTNIVASNSPCGFEKENSSYYEYENEQNNSSNILKFPIVNEIVHSQHLNEHTTIIRETVQTAICEMRPEPFMCYDAAIVYDRRDYDNVLEFKQEVTKITEHSGIKDPIRIELYDSDHFAQSYVKVVEDVLSKCGVVFIYLTKHTNTTFINYFCEEAIATTEFPESISFNDPLGYKRCIIKPVHTSPSSSRTYKTPAGLTSFTCINWYDRKSGFTQEQVVAILKDAIFKRKRKESEKNTPHSFAFMVSMKT